MTQEADIGSDETPRKERSRSPNKTFPSATFEQALVLPKGIVEHGFTAEIQRLTLMDELSMSPNSSRTRELISSSYKYGLTEGSHNTLTLSVTAEGRQMAGSTLSANEDKRLGFSLAIERFEPFLGLYKLLKDNRLRQGPVLHDEFRKLGVYEADCPQAAEIFTENLRFLGLVRDVSGSEFVISIDALPEAAALPSNIGPNSSAQPEPVPTVPVKVDPPPRTNIATPKEPAVHIDVQIHIDSSASAEQIDQIFSSMARHLYGRES